MLRPHCPKQVAGPEDSASRADLQDLTLHRAIIVWQKQERAEMETSGAHECEMDPEFLRLAA